MRLLGERYRISRFLRTDNLYKFLLPSFGDGYFLVNRKPVNVNSWFGYDVDQSILHTYVAFCMFVESSRYKITFQFIHKTAEGRNISEYVYKKPQH